MTIILYILFFYGIKYIDDGMYSLLGPGGAQVLLRWH